MVQIWALGKASKIFKSIIKNLWDSKNVTWKFMACDPGVNQSMANQRSHFKILKYVWNSQFK